MAGRLRSALEWLEVTLVERIIKFSREAYRPSDGFTIVNAEQCWCKRRDREPVKSDFE